MANCPHRFIFCWQGCPDHQGSCRFLEDPIRDTKSMAVVPHVHYVVAILVSHLVLVSDRRAISDSGR
ncbi:MAG: hypothetical protein HN978_19920 [Desulfobacula sp.]|nr:hypothetical protein [Desulfobacula sp.]MBT7051920.1 hypothetical protein [Desulfobacula sp.]MBT7259608.1 hypothetical protein [Desulfobacula sp.]